MSKDRSFAAVKKAIGGGPFRGKRNVLVNMGEITFLYKDVFVSATYNIAYMQMDIDVVWEDDSSQPDYHTLGLHGRYNSSFQDFRYEDGYLRWKDGAASISILFKPGTREAVSAGLSTTKEASLSDSLLIDIEGVIYIVPYGFV